LSPPPPEASLQLALDLPSLSACQSVVAELAPRPARAEVGTPLLLHEGIRAVEWLRGTLGPAGTVVADTKICDAGARIARDAFAAGADVVTVVGAAADMTTWKGVLQAADVSPGRPAVLIDTVGWEPAAAAAGLTRLCDAAGREGVRVDVCVHRPKNTPPPFAELLAQLWAAGAPHSPGYLVAGQVTGGLVRPALMAGFGIIIVGGAVTEVGHPASVWSALLEEVAGSRTSTGAPC
jgi:3-keto-L-gulonate-6-phosphate decarboxylase